VCFPFGRCAVRDEWGGGVCVCVRDPGREVLAWGVFCDVGERGLIGAFVGMG